MLHVGLAVLLYAIHGATVNTLVENGDGVNTFHAFNPTQAEEASMVTANRFSLQIFGIAFFATTLTVLGSLLIMFSHYMWIGGADESADQIYALDSCMVGEVQELADGTLGAASNLETSYIGVVLDSSCRNTNLNKSIPVSSGYAERAINAMSAPVVGIGHVEMSAFHGVGLPVPDFMRQTPEYGSSASAIDGMIPIDIWLELNIGGRILDKSTVAIGAIIIDQDACY
jgi:hypothetical protein